MKVEYLIGIIILLVVILLLIVNCSKEGFVTNQELYDQHSELYQKKYNKIGTSLIVVGNEAALGSDTTDILGKIEDTVNSNNTIVQKIVSDYPLEGGESGMSLLIKKCEAITPVITFDDCKKLDDPSINSTCGICLADPTDMGRNSEGAQWAGGLVLTARDRKYAQSQRKGNFLAPYIPTVGSCPAGRMVATRTECERLQKELMCQKSGTFDSSSGCSQCFNNGNYNIVDSNSNPDLIIGSGILMVVGSGTLTFSESVVSNNNNGSFELSSTPQSIPLSGPEYTKILLRINPNSVPTPYQENKIYRVNDFIRFIVDNVENVYQMQEGAGAPGYAPNRPGDQLWTLRGTWADYPYKTTIPAFIAGYLQTPDGDVSQKLDLYRIIITDSETGRKPRTVGQVTVAGDSFTKMAAGYGKTSMNFTAYSPFSFINPLSQEATLCSNSPFITKPESASLLNSDPCYARGSGPGKYNLDCLQQIFQNNGCGLSSATLDKSGFPSTSAKAAALMIDSNGTAQTIDQIANTVYQAALSTATSLNAEGEQLSLADWSKASQFCTGVAINSPCDANAASGPLSPDCIVYLWDNQGANKITGATYSLSSLGRSLFSSGKTDRFCTRKGTKAPKDLNNIKNQVNIDYWTGFGGVAAVKEAMSRLHMDANTSLTNEDSKASSIKECYGIVPNARVSYKSTYAGYSEPNKLVQGTVLKNNINLPENYDYTLSFDITPYDILFGNYGGIIRITSSTSGNSFPPAYGERNPLILFAPSTLQLYIILGDHGTSWQNWNWGAASSEGYLFPALIKNEKSSVSIKATGSSVIITVGSTTQTYTQPTKRTFSRTPDEKYTFYASDNIFPAANAMIEKINYTVNGITVLQTPPAPAASTGPGQSL